MDFNRQWQNNTYSTRNLFHPRREGPPSFDGDIYSRNNRYIRRDGGSRGFGNRGYRGFGDRGHRGFGDRGHRGFNDRGNRGFGDRRFQNRYPDDRRHYPYPQRNMKNPEDIPDLSNDVDPSIYKSPLELKIEKLISAVQSQGIIGQIILVETNTGNTKHILGNACQNIPNCKLEVKENYLKKLYELSINDDVLAEGVFDNKATARTELTDAAVDILRKRCFYITKCENYEEVNTGETSKVEEESDSTPANMEGSKAFQMMLKMGWGGKGLGAQEQGREKTVADTIVENITKEGLGSKNVIAEVDAILKDFAQSTKLSTIAFNSSFTKDERAQIHTLAAKYNLATKSVGRDENRRITVKKKISRWDLVKELLRVGLENESYKLEIPQDFLHLWQEENAL